MCLVMQYNAEVVPAFQSPMIAGLVANALGIYTVPGVLPCYCKVLPCYCESVTGNSIAPYSGAFSSRYKPRRIAIC